MISDVFADAVYAVDHYLNSEVHRDVYEGKLRKEIVAIRNRMEAVATFLDSRTDISLFPIVPFPVAGDCSDTELFYHAIRFFKDVYHYQYFLFTLLSKTTI